MLRKWVGWLLVCTMAFGLFWLSSPKTLNHYVFKEVLARIALQELAVEKGWHLMVNFSGPDVQNEVDGKRVQVVGCEETSQGNGVGRQFDGNRDHYISFPVRWSDLGTSFTVGARLKLRPAERQQYVLGFYGKGIRQGFVLEGDVLRFYLTDSEQVCEVSHRVSRWDEWVHVCFTYDHEEGAMKLFVDGRKVDEAACAAYRIWPVYLEAGKQESMRALKPYWGAIDDVIAKEGALDEAEVAALSSREATLIDLLPREAGKKMRRVSALVRWANPAATGRAKLFRRPPFSGDSAYEKLPEVQLSFSEKVATEFEAVWSHAKASGLVPMDRLDLEKGRVATASGEGQKEKVALFLPDESYLKSKSGSWIVENSSGWAPLDASWVVVVPAASVPWQDMLMGTHLAASSGIIEGPRICLRRLRIDGEAMGLHLVCDYELMVNSEKAWLRRAPDVNRIAGMSLDALRTWADTHVFPFSAAAARTAAPGEEMKAFQLDRRTRKEWLAAVAQTAAEPAERRLGIGLTHWGAARIMGNNPVAGVVFNPLQLPTHFGKEIQFTYSVSDDALVSADGTIIGRDNERLTTLTEVATMDSVAITNRFLLWVPELPMTLPLFDMRTLKSLRSSPRDYGLVCRWAEQGDSYAVVSEDPVGVKYRGNTKLYRHKKSYSIDTGHKHGLFASGQATHYYLNIFDADESYLRDPLAMAFYREISGLPAKEIPEISFALGLHNKRKHGVYHFTERMSRRFLGWDNPKEGELGDGVLIKSRDIQFDPELPMYSEQLYPEVANATGLDFLTSLVAVVQGPVEAFQQNLDEHLDLNLFMAYHLNLLLTGNVDGDANNYFLYAERDPDSGRLGRWKIKPWDYDHGFTTSHFQTNYLIRRLEVDHPEYRSRMIARWRALRAGPFTDAAMHELISTTYGAVAPYAVFDQTVWGKDPANHTREMVRLRAWILERLGLIDTYMNELEQR